MPIKPKEKQIERKNKEYKQNKINKFNNSDEEEEPDSNLFVMN